jgi:hypothetical protein
VLRSRCALRFGAAQILAAYRARISHLYFGASLKDTSAIGFDDAFQYKDFTKPWSERRIASLGDHPLSMAS